MPKVGAYKIPNYDIEKVSNLIIEVGQRFNSVTAGEVDEDIFQEEYIQKSGGTYQSYRYSMERYGFIYRSKGSDVVELTELFEKVADPLETEAREEAKTEAVRNVQLLTELFQSEISRTVSLEDLRRHLVVDIGIPKGEIEQKQLERLEKLYESAYPYLERGMTVQSETDKKAPSTGPSEGATEEEQPSEAGKAKASSPSVETGRNVIRIRGLTLELDSDDVEDEWDRAKSTIDAYLEAESENN